MVQRNNLKSPWRRCYRQWTSYSMQAVSVFPRWRGGCWRRKCCEYSWLSIRWNKYVAIFPFHVFELWEYLGTTSRSRCAVSERVKNIQEPRPVYIVGSPQNLQTKRQNRQSEQKQFMQSKEFEAIVGGRVLDGSLSQMSTKKATKNARNCHQIEL